MKDFSYWELQTWFKNVDFCIIGSGIVGLNCALHLRERYPKSRILVLERGMLPQGASTKNAGFACFGSLSEIIDDLQSHSLEEVIELVEKRYEGLKQLRKTLGENKISYQNNGGFELFAKEDVEMFERCLENREAINKMLFPIFKEDIFSLKDNSFNFKNIQNQYLEVVLFFRRHHISCIDVRLYLSIYAHPILLLLDQKSNLEQVMVY